MDTGKSEKANLLPAGPYPGSPVAQTTEVNLNRLIAAAVRQTGQVAGSVILRMDELPAVLASPEQIGAAFRLLLQAMLAHVPPGQKVYCSVKAAPQGPTLLDQKDRRAVFGIAIQCNASLKTGAPPALLEQAAGLLAKNKISFEYKSTAAGDVLFLLTVHSSAFARGSLPATGPGEPGGSG